MKALFILILIGLLSTGKVHSQSSGEFWTGPEVNIEAAKNLDISGSVEMRSSNMEYPAINAVFSQLGASYKLNKFFRVKGDLRYYFHDTPGLRYNLDATARYKLKPVIISWRNRYQTAYKEQVYNENKGFTGSKTMIRSKFELKLDLDNTFTPFAGIDFFYGLAGGGVREAGYEGFRFSTGVEYEFVKNHEVSVGYNYQNPGYGSPFKRHMLTVNYSFNIKKAKKKEKKG